VWSLDLAGSGHWAPLQISGGPGWRFEHTAIYDPEGDRMIVFGGSNGDDLNDVWSLSLSGTPVWTQLFPAGTPPVPRKYSTAVYDSRRQRMILFGGKSDAPPLFPDLGDVWELTLAATPEWHPLSVMGPSPGTRRDHAAIYDPERDRMIVFGGYTNLPYTWALDLSGAPTWEPLPDGPGLQEEGAVYDPTIDGVVVTGGNVRPGLNQFASGGAHLLLLSDDAGVSPGGPEPFSLRVVSANPGSGRVRAELRLDARRRVVGTVFDVRGRRVRSLLDRELGPGRPTVEWDGLDDSGASAPPGVYVLLAQTPRDVASVKLVRMR
jgi:hypothetical protein